jgi:hypothetical protein
MITTKNLFKNSKAILAGQDLYDCDEKINGKMGAFVNSEDEAATKMIGNCDSTSDSSSSGGGGGGGGGGKKGAGGSGSGSGSESSEEKPKKITAKGGGDGGVTTAPDALLIAGKKHKKKHRRRRGHKNANEKVANIGAQGFMEIEKKGAFGHKAEPFHSKKKGDKYVEFSCSASLAELQSGAKEARLVCTNPKLAELLGGEDLPISSMEVVKFNNPSPVSVGLLGTHYKGNEHNFISSAGAFLSIFDPASVTKDAPHLPVTVHQAKPSAFQMKMAKHYPNQTPVSMIKAVMPGFEEGKKVLPAGSALMIPIRDQIESDEKLCAEKKIDYTGATLESLAVRHNNLITGYQVPNEMVEFAANWITTCFERTKDTLNVNTEFYLPFARAGLPCESLSAAGEHWTHRAEIEQNPKVANVEKALTQPYTWTALVKVRFGNE